MRTCLHPVVPAELENYQMANKGGGEEGWWCWWCLLFCCYDVDQRSLLRTNHQHNKPMKTKEGHFTVTLKMKLNKVGCTVSSGSVCVCRADGFRFM